MRKTLTIRLARAGVVAGLYVVLSLLVLPVASGALQFRISEALCILPLLYLEAAPALMAGCLISNLISGCALYDVIFGSLVTLVAALLTCGAGRLIKNTALKIFTGGLFPVLLNAFLLPVIWYFCYGELEYLYILQVAFLIISQGAAVYLLGTAAYLPLSKMKDKGVAFLQ